MHTKTIILSMFCLLSLNAFSQSIEQAQKLSTSGNYTQAIKILQEAVRKRVPNATLELAKVYDKAYRFDEAEKACNEHINFLKKKKTESQEANDLLAKIHFDQRAIKGVEDVAIIDSLVIDKKDFLSAYKLSDEA